MVNTGSMVDYNFTYYDEMKYLCLKNCFYQNMDYLGIAYPLLRIKTGLSLKILLDQDNKTFVAFKHSVLMPFFKMDMIKYGSGNNFLKHFEANLEALPVIVLVDVYYLPYRQEYKKYHASHAIFFTNYDGVSRQVQIIDWYSPYFFKGNISLENFKLARMSDNPKDINPFSGFAINNYWYKIQKDDIKDEISQTIHSNILEMKSAESKKNSNIYVGKQAFIKIKEHMECCLEDTELKLNEVCKHVHDELFVFYRASLLSLRYYELVRSSNIYPISNSQIKEILIIKNTMERLNFCLLKGSVTCSKKTFEKSISLVDLLCYTYNSI